MPPAALVETRELASAYMHRASDGARRIGGRCVAGHSSMHHPQRQASCTDCVGVRTGSWVAALTLGAVFVESGTPDADAEAYTAALAGMRLVVGEGVALQGFNGESAFWRTKTGILC